MAFKLKSGFLKSSGFKKMGATASPLTKTSPLKAEEKAYGGDRTWSEGQKASGGTLNDLARKGKTLEKGSNEWKKNQNKINEALGSKKRYDVADAAAPVVKENKLTGRTTTTTTREDPNSPSNTITTDTKKRKDGTISKITEEDAPNMAGDTGKGDKKRVWKDQPGRKGSRNVVKSGRDTEDKSDDVKKVTKVRGGKKQTQTTRTRTADTVSKTKYDLKTGDSTTTSRKRLGKGLIKDVVAKAKAKKAAKKAGKVKGSKAPKGTTYDPSDDSSNMPT